MTYRRPSELRFHRMPLGEGYRVPSPDPQHFIYLTRFLQGWDVTLQYEGPDSVIPLRYGSSFAENFAQAKENARRLYAEISSLLAAGEEIP